MKRQLLKEFINTFILLAVNLALILAAQYAILPASVGVRLAIFIPLGILDLVAIIYDLYINGITKRFCVTVALVLYLLILCLAVGFGWISGGAGIAWAIALPLGCGLISLAVEEFLTKRVSSFINTHKKGALWALTSLSVALIFLICYFIAPICAFFGIKDAAVLEGVFQNADLFSYYTAQLSITFISISVLSVLSDKSVIIYWANVSEDRLIKPTFKCFAAYTYYSIGAAVGSGLGIILGNGLVFAAFFAVNTLVMIALTASMVDVYYGRDVKIRKLKNELIKDYYSGRKPQAKPDEEYAPVSSAGYREKLLGLRQHLYNSYEGNAFTELKEMYELYASCPDVFYSKEGENAVKTIVETVDEKTLSIFVSTLLGGLNSTLFKVELEQVKQRNSWRYLYNKTRAGAAENGPEPFLWDVDKPLWKTLAVGRFTAMIKSAEHHAIRMNEKTLRDLLLHIKKRIAFIYNYEVFKMQDADPQFKAMTYLLDTSRFKTLPPYRKGAENRSAIEKEKIGQLLSTVKEQGIMPYLLRLTDDILEVYPEFEEDLADFPYHK